LTDLADISVRPARADDAESIWPMLRGVIRGGESFAIDRGLTRDRALKMWLEAPRATYVTEHQGEVLGTYYINTNHPGGGAHVCNCGYIVAPQARGQGLARAMCLHSQAEARKLGYLAMQFNLVVTTNTAAVHLWQDMGFDTVGRLPRAFDHPRDGLVDALVMMKWLDGV
jgi:ribosomal protein S18 acetylase RimI-like enzyme